MTITPESLREMEDWKPLTVATILFDRSRELSRVPGEWFIEVGLICAEVERRELWREMMSKSGTQFRSWSGWVNETFGESKSSAFEAADAVKNLKDDVPLETLKEIPRCNLKQLKDCSTAAKRDPEMHKAALEKSEAEFVKVANWKHNQHLEHRDFFHLAPVAEQKVTLAETIELVRIEQGDPQRSVTDCIVHACQFYLDAMEEANARQIAKQVAEAGVTLQ